MDSSVNEGVYFALATLEKLKQYTNPGPFRRCLIIVLPINGSTIVSNVMETADVLGDSLLICNSSIV